MPRTLLVLMVAAALGLSACGGSNDVTTAVLTPTPTLADVETLPSTAPPGEDPSPSTTPTAAASPTPEVTATPAPESSAGPVDAEAVAAAVREHRARPEACDGMAMDVPEGEYDHEVHMPDSGVVIAVLCENFAYQGTWELLGWDGDSLVALEVEQWVDGIEYHPVVLGYPEVWDGALVNLEKARGVGDCGTFSTWFLDQAYLGLAVVRQRDCDDESEPVEPDYWPVVYPSGD